MRTVDQVKNLIKWESVSLANMKADLSNRKKTNEPIERLLYCIKFTEIRISYLEDELAKLEGE
jgi:hypothetical protein